MIDKFNNNNPPNQELMNVEGACQRGSVFLVSMKAGGVGLNLVAASTVFIIDPWWNMAVEDVSHLSCFDTPLLGKFLGINELFFSSAMHQSNSSYWSGGRISESEKVCRDRLCRGKDRETSNEKEGERRNDTYKVYCPSR